MNRYVGPSAEDYAPYYKRFFKNPFSPCYFNWLPRHIFTITDISAIQLLERPRDFFRYMCGKEEYPFRGLRPASKQLIPKLATYFVDKKNALIRKAIIALRLRAAFRRLVHAWIWRKAARTPLPENDIITMAPFVRPVIITDMGLRYRYKFETSPLLRHIESQLNYVSYGFIQPLHPLNPITNLQFSSSQLIEIYKQCLKHGQINATFAAFAACKFNLARYQLLYSQTISINYNVNTVTAIRDETGQEMLLEFIEDIADLLLDTLSIAHIQKIKYGLEHFPEHPFFKKWRRLFIAKQFCNEDTIEDRLLFDLLMIRAKDLLDIRSVVLNEICRDQLQADDE